MRRRLLAALAASVFLSVVALAATPAPAFAATTYFYAGGRQTITDNSVLANFAVAKPTLATGDFHTYAAIAIRGGPNGTDTIQIGWNVDPVVNGDSEPHLFVFWWKNGVAQCYNAGCPGFTAVAGATYAAGQRLLPGNAQAFGITHAGNAWWLRVGTSSSGLTNIGYLLDSNWSTAWPTFAKFEVYGAVTANTASPTTQMGNGFCSTNALAITIGSVTLGTNPTSAVNLTGTATNAAKYSSTLLSKRTLRYGGDGSCP